MDGIRKSFVFYQDWFEMLRDLDKDSKVELYDAIASVGLGYGMPELSPASKLVMKLIESKIERDRERWGEISRKRKEVGRLGGLSKSKQTKQLVAIGSKSKQKVANEANVAVYVSKDTNVSMLDNNNNLNNKEEDTNVSPKKSPINYQEVVDCWNTNCGKMWGNVAKLTDKRKHSIKKIIDAHDISQEELMRFFSTLRYADHWLSNPTGEHKNWKPDFDWWMSNANGWFTKALEGKVHTQNPVKFDIIMKGDSQTTYSPSGMKIWFNEETKSYWTDELYIEHLCDGYEDSDRPDGAMLTLHNARGKIVWNKDTNEWVKHSYV